MNSFKISLFIIFLLTISMCASVKKKKRKDYKFLGVKFNQKGRGQEKTYANYFVSTTTSPWGTALHDCETVYGDTGTLLTNVDEEKFKFIQELLQQHGEVGSYWIGGVYEQEYGCFAWIRSEQNVSTGAGWSKNPWVQNLPKLKNEPQQRLLLVHRGEEVHWSIELGTMAKRYICEVAYSKNNCVQNTDLVFVLDNGLMRIDLLPKPQWLIENIIAAFKPISRSRFGLLIYFKNHVKWVYHMTSFYGQDEIKKQFKQCGGSGDPPYCLPEKGDDVILGINEAKKVLIQDFSPGVPMNIVILTTGATSRSKQDISAAVNGALKEAINVFVIPMWSTSDASSLASFTGGKPERVFRFDQDGQLQSVFEKVLPAICES